jgi:2-iminobutanoate/2-iminopropanoate deaminase
MAERNWRPVELTGVQAPAGAYSRAVHAGGLIFVSGQVPRDFETGALLGSDVAAQTRATLDNLRRVLGAAGASLSDVVSVTVYLQNAGDWGAFNEVYRSAFTTPYPSRTTVGADLRDVLVEISAVAVAPAGK